jgi:hypothetical protein
MSITKRNSKHDSTRGDLSRAAGEPLAIVVTVAVGRSGNR